jgi:hypothetical protein
MPTSGASSAREASRYHPLPSRPARDLSPRPTALRPPATHSHAAIRAAPSPGVSVSGNDQYRAVVECLQRDREQRQNDTKRRDVRYADERSDRMVRLHAEAESPDKVCATCRRSAGSGIRCGHRPTEHRGDQRLLRRPGDSRADGAARRRTRRRASRAAPGRERSADVPSTGRVGVEDPGPGPNAADAGAEAWGQDFGTKPAQRPRQRLPGYRTDRARLSLRLRPGHPRSAGRSARRRRTTRPRPRRAVPGRTAHRGTRQGTPGRPGAPCR